MLTGISSIIYGGSDASLWIAKYATPKPMDEQKKKTITGIGCETSRVKRRRGSVGGGGGDGVYNSIHIGFNLNKSGQFIEVMNGGQTLFSDKEIVCCVNNGMKIHDEGISGSPRSNTAF